MTKFFIILKDIFRTRLLFQVHSFHDLLTAEDNKVAMVQWTVPSVLPSFFFNFKLNSSIIFH